MPAVSTSLRAAPPFRAADYINDNKPHLLLAATGSVATIKIPQIVTALCSYKLSIRILLSNSAAEFLQSQSAEQPSLASILEIPNVDGIYRDESEWETPWTRGAPILHIELRRWADLMVIAPLSANSLAKMVQGMADSLVLSVARAWDTTGLIDKVQSFPASAEGAAETLEHAGTRNGGEARATAGKKVMVVAPAMNTAMWMHPVTGKQIKVLEEEWGIEHGGWVQVLRPVEKELACGDTGSGAMRNWNEIVAVIEQRLGLRACGP